MNNKEIAKIFDQIADILEINGENVFRIRSYRRAAQLIENHQHSFVDLAKKGAEELEQIKGIGKDLAQKIIEIAESGRCSFLEKIKENFPAGLLEMLEIRGLGPKKIKLFREQLQIENIAALKQAALDQQLQELPGMGAKSEAEILKAIDEMEQMSGRMNLHVAKTTATACIEYIKSKVRLQKITYAGSLRRCQESVGDLDILAVGDDPEAIFEAFLSYPEISNVIAKGETKSSVILQSGVQVDLRVVPAESFGAALHYFTGSKQHNIAIRSRAQKMNLKVNEYGVFDENEKQIAGKTEMELFASLKLDFIEPEMRADSGEIELAADSFEGKAQMPRLIQLKDLQGDLHAHTAWSDGANSIEEMVNFYQKKGFKYLALTDHSPSLRVANGLDIARLRAKNAEIDQLKVQGFEILKGSEVDILLDGSLDYPDEVLGELDVVVASIHSGFKHDSKFQTERILKAIRNPHVNIIAHPHGRLIGKRDGYEIDLEVILRAAKEYDVAIEINSQALRLDLNDVNCRLAKEYGVKLAINSDAHHCEQSEFLAYGVGTARRGWIEAKDVINTWDLVDLQNFLRKNK